MTDPIVIPARRGKAALVRQGQTITVINTHGEQVVDTWAFNRHDLNEFMSMEHGRATHHHMIPRRGDALLTNHRRPILTILEDTSGGIHDTLMAACDRYRYEELGCTEYHDNCTDNLAAAAVRNAPAMKSATGNVRVPLGPRNRTAASSTMSTVTRSAAGSA